MEKPASVKLASNLLWISVGMGLIKQALIGFPLPSDTNPMIVYGVMIFVLGITAVIFLQISAGRNWARITYAVMYVFGLLSLAAMLSVNQRMHTPLNIAVAVVQTLMQGYALYLIFTKPGSLWFSTKITSTNAEQARTESTTDDGFRK